MSNSGLPFNLQDQQQQEKYKQTLKDSVQNLVHHLKSRDPNYKFDENDSNDAIEKFVPALASLQNTDQALQDFVIKTLFMNDSEIDSIYDLDPTLKPVMQKQAVRLYRNQSLNYFFNLLKTLITQSKRITDQERFEKFQNEKFVAYDPNQIQSASNIVNVTQPQNIGPNNTMINQVQQSGSNQNLNQQQLSIDQQQIESLEKDIEAIEKKSILEKEELQKQIDALKNAPQQNINVVQNVLNQKKNLILERMDEQERIKIELDKEIQNLNAPIENATTSWSIKDINKIGELSKGYNLLEFIQNPPAFKDLPFVLMQLLEKHNLDAWKPYFKKTYEMHLDNLRDTNGDIDLDVYKSAISQQARAFFKLMKCDMQCQVCDVPHLYSQIDEHQTQCVVKHTKIFSKCHYYLIYIQELAMYILPCFQCHKNLKSIVQSMKDKKRQVGVFYENQQVHLIKHLAQTCIEQNNVMHDMMGIEEDQIKTELQFQIGREKLIKQHNSDYPQSYSEYQTQNEDLFTEIEEHRSTGGSSSSQQAQKNPQEDWDYKVGFKGNCALFPDRDGFNPNQPYPYGDANKRQNTASGTLGTLQTTTLYQQQFKLKSNSTIRNQIKIDKTETCGCQCHLVLKNPQAHYFLRTSNYKKKYDDQTQFQYPLAKLQVKNARFNGLILTLEQPTENIKFINICIKKLSFDQPQFVECKGMAGVAVFQPFSREYEDFLHTIESYKKELSQPWTSEFLDAEIIDYQQQNGKESLVFFHRLKSGISLPVLDVLKKQTSADQATNILKFIMNGALQNSFKQMDDDEYWLDVRMEDIFFFRSSKFNGRICYVMKQRLSAPRLVCNQNDSFAELYGQIKPPKAKKSKDKKQKQKKSAQQYPQQSHTQLNDAQIICTFALDTFFREHIFIGNERNILTNYGNFCMGERNVPTTNQMGLFLDTDSAKGRGLDDILQLLSEFLQIKYFNTQHDTQVATNLQSKLIMGNQRILSVIGDNITTTLLENFDAAITHDFDDCKNDDIWKYHDIDNNQMKDHSVAFMVVSGAKFLNWDFDKNQLNSNK